MRLALILRPTVHLRPCTLLRASEPPKQSSSATRSRRCSSRGMWPTSLRMRSSASTGSSATSPPGRSEVCSPPVGDFPAARIWCGSLGVPAMRLVLPALLTAVCVLGAATDALACRMRAPRPDELAQRTLVIATVKHAERVEAPGWNTWRVVAEHVPDAEGRPTFEFLTTLTSDGCGQTPLPPAGERWVLYLDQVAGEVLDAFPLDHAKDFDGRLADVR